MHPHVNTRNPRADERASAWVDGTRTTLVSELLFSSQCISQIGVLYTKIVDGKKRFKVFPVCPPPAPAEI